MKMHMNLYLNMYIYINREKERNLILDIEGISGVISPDFTLDIADGDGVSTMISPVRVYKYV
jgi:hypothetical protein